MEMLHGKWLLMSLLQGSDPSGGYVMGILLGKGLPMPLLQEVVLREGHVTEMLLTNFLGRDSSAHGNQKLVHRDNPSNLHSKDRAGQGLMAACP